MKLKKLCAAVMSGILAFSAMAGAIPSSDDGALLQATASITAEAATALRRPCNAENPMWIVFIESWNTPDPQKIINLIPEDIKPYVVFNISMSIYWNRDTHSWGMVQNGYELAKSWIKACADEGIWCMIQPSSGGQCHFPDYDSSGNMVSFPNKGNFVSHADADYENTIYAEFFRDYPNFIGFNYCEQFWGFEQDDFPITCPQRYQHFASLLKLCNKYGGYLDISWCGNEWSPNINPLAMLKQVPSWEEACRNYSQNLILEENTPRQAILPMWRALFTATMFPATAETSVSVMMKPAGQTPPGAVQAPPLRISSIRQPDCRSTWKEWSRMVQLSLTVRSWLLRMTSRKPMVIPTAKAIM